MSLLDGTSFSQRVKDELLSIETKKKCCKRAFEDAVSLRSVVGDRARLIKSERMVCDNCRARYAAGLFVSFGSVTDPQKAHHLEFSFSTEAERDAAEVILCELGFEPASTQRKGRHIAYFKSSDSIVDLLGTFGANNAMFEYLNARIIGSIKNDTNRRVNFDNANIKKSLDATQEQIRVIDLIVDNGLLNELSADLRETAWLRLDNPEISLAALGLKFNDPISKSGVNHRMEKIFEFARRKKLI